MTDPVRKTLTVPLRPEQAFDLFTDRIAEWWPTETHSISAGDGAEPRDVRIEPREGGAVIEDTHDGGTARWGRVTTWEPGRRIGIAWHVGRPAEESTDLDVTFTPVEDGTRVDLTHGGFERLAETASLRGGYDRGWDLVLLRCYGGFCRAHLPA